MESDWKIAAGPIVAIPLPVDGYVEVNGTYFPHGKISVWKMPAADSDRQPTSKGASRRLHRLEKVAT